MTCPEYLDALRDAALDGELGAGLRAHLTGCIACRQELDRLRALAGAIDQGVSAMVDADPSPGFAAGVRARLAEETTQRAAWWRGWIPALAGGVAALALAAWLLWPRVPPSQPGPPNMAGPGGGQPLPPAEVATEHAHKVDEAPPKLRAIRVLPPRRAPVHKAERPAAFPEVLVTGDEWAQVVNFYRLVQRREIAAGELTAPDTTPLEEKIKPLVIAQLDPIPPLAEPPAGEPRR